MHEHPIDKHVSIIRTMIGGEMYSTSALKCFSNTMAVGNNILAIVNNTNGVGPKSIKLYSLDPKDYDDGCNWNWDRDWDEEIK